MPAQARTNRNHRFALHLTLAVAVGGLASASAQTWSGGTPYGGSVFALQQSPDAGSLFAATPGGLFRSDDGGAHWVRKLAGTPLSGPGLVTGFAPSASQAGRLWLADVSGHIYRSDDNGESIALIHQLPVATGDLTGLSAVPQSNDQLYALTARSGLWYSADAGNTFVQRNLGMDPGTSITQLAISSSNPSWMMAIGNTGNLPALYYSFSAGAGWIASPGYPGVATTAAFNHDSQPFLGVTRVNGGVYVNWNFASGWQRYDASCDVHAILLNGAGADPELLGCAGGIVQAGTGLMVDAPPLVTLDMPATIRALLRDRTDPSRLGAATDHAGVFASTDNGNTWTAANNGLSAASIRSVAVHPRHPQRVLAGYNDEQHASANPGMLLSDDGGTSWTPSDLHELADIVRGVTFDPTGNDVAASAVYAVGVDSANLANSGVYKSQDGGTHWSAVDGPYVGTVRDLVLDPRSCAAPPSVGPCTQGPLQTFYAIATAAQGDHSFRVMRSDDAGASLTARSAGLPADLVYPSGGKEWIYPLALAIEARHTQRLYIGTYLQQNWLANGTPPRRPSPTASSAATMAAPAGRPPATACRARPVPRIPP